MGGVSTNENPNLGPYIIHRLPKYPLVKPNSIMKMYGKASLLNKTYVSN